MESSIQAIPYLAWLENRIKKVFLLASEDWSALHYVTPSYETVWERPRQALFASPLAWTEAVTPDDRALVEDSVLRSGPWGPDRRLNLEFRIIRPDGGLRHLAATVGGLRHPRGQGIALLMEAEDLTELKEAKSRLSELEAKLAEAKSAFNMLLDNRNEQLGQLAGDIEATRRKLVQPCLERLRRSRLDERQRALLASLEASLRELSSPLERKLPAVFSKLTPREAEIASLVRQGRGNGEIADQLNISENAVAFHRQNLRSKLGLIGKRINLYSYLNSDME